MEKGWHSDRGWFEDFETGMTFHSPGKTITEAEIMDWALQFDPQYFHMDKVEAEKSIYGGIIASGWHTGALSFRLFIETKPFAPGASMGSPGLDELRWLAPVRPGDTVRVIATVTNCRASRSKPDLGLVEFTSEMLNQRDEVVLRTRANTFVRRRPQE